MTAILGRFGCRQEWSCRVGPRDRYGESMGGTRQQQHMAFLTSIGLELMWVLIEVGQTSQSVSRLNQESLK